MTNKPLTIREFFGAQKAGGLPTFNHKWLRDNLIIATAVFALILLQPFGLNDVALGPRVAYWAVISAGGYCLFGFVLALGGTVLTKLDIDLPYPAAIVFCCLIASVLMTFFVLLAGTLFFDIPADYTEQFTIVFPQVITISTVLIAVTIGIDYVQERNRQLQPCESFQASHKRTVDAFLTNLPIQKRGELFCLEAQDHYVRVHTDKGQHLVLMRLKDAVAMLEDAQGFQVHRSWWIAKSAVTETMRDGRKISFLLKSGIVVPVSRKWQSTAKDLNLVK